MAKDPFEAMFDSLGSSIDSAINRGPSDQLPAAIYDTFKTLWKHQERKPLIIAKTLIKSTDHMERLDEMMKDGIDRFPEEPDPPKPPTLALPKLPKRNPKYKKEDYEPIYQRLKKKLDIPEKLTPQEIMRWVNARPKKKETWYFVINLPGEISYQEFLSKQSNFETAVGGWVEISKIGAAVYMKCSNVLLKRFIPYAFDPLEYSNMDLPMLMGYDSQGPVVIDLAEALSILLAGLRKYGKSVAIAGMIYSLLLQNKDPLNPKAQLLIIDTEVAEFDFYEPYGPVWVSNHSDAFKAFNLLNEEAARRKKVIMPVANSLTDYRKLGHIDIPYIVVILDELAGLGMFHDSIYKILREYRKWGIFVIGATQRPSARMWDKFKKDSWMETKSQFEVRLGFKMVDPINARMIFDSDRCYYLPAKLPGRAILFWDEEREIQVPYFPRKIEKQKLQAYLDKLQPVPYPYENIRGEVYEADEKSIYPCPRSHARSQSALPSRTKFYLDSGTNPFA